MRLLSATGSHLSDYAQFPKSVKAEADSVSGLGTFPLLPFQLHFRPTVMK
ncbi:MAG: hypothetical protein BWY82_00584 [Verrucomicrobia bacterium ADurb.Bin474]|nr:MAG: hypothetical protein BWY82_00584 [Verrucomicrobia bacterium ADurb.Bin474]